MKKYKVKAGIHFIADHVMVKKGDTFEADDSFMKRDDFDRCFAVIGDVSKKEEDIVEKEEDIVEKEEDIVEKEEDIVEKEDAGSLDEAITVKENVKQKRGKNK